MSSAITILDPPLRSMHLRARLACPVPLGKATTDNGSAQSVLLDRRSRRYSHDIVACREEPVGCRSGTLCGVLGISPGVRIRDIPACPGVEIDGVSCSGARSVYAFVLYASGLVSISFCEETCGKPTMVFIYLIPLKAASACALLEEGLLSRTA